MILAIPEGKSFVQMPVSHFTKLSKKIGRDQVLAAIDSLEKVPIQKVGLKVARVRKSLGAK